MRLVLRHRAANLFCTVWLLTSNASDLIAQGKYSFDLDVPVARFSYWKIEDIGLATRLTADLEIRELRKDSQWKPTFQLVIGRDDKSVALVLTRDGENTVSASLRVVEQDKTVADGSIDAWKLKKAQRFLVQMDWSTAGSVAVSSDGQSWGRFPLSFAPQSVTVAASTGELVAHSLNLAGK